MEALNIIAAICFYAFSSVSVYYFILTLIGMIFHKQKYPSAAPKAKFCIFVPCHNEEAVIGATVENYTKITYDPKLYDIYFIADNCSDHTADEIKKACLKANKENFHVLERHVDDPNLKGKPHALRWGIAQLEGQGQFYDKYDLFMILDADNFVDPTILNEINSQRESFKGKNKPVLIQCYLDSKNRNTIIARGYFSSYRICNGFWQWPKYLLHLNAAIGGTGFSIETSFLKEIGGYCCTSLTEDLEIETITTLRNKRVAVNVNAHIYDEKPTHLHQSMVQITRWSQGHWWNYFHYTWSLFLGLFDLRHISCFFRKLDNIIYLFAMANLVLGLAFLILRIVCFFMKIPLLYVPDYITWPLFGIGIYAILMVIIGALIDGKGSEKKRAFIEFFPNAVGLVIESFVFLYAAVVGLFKCPNQKTWKKTVHKVTSMDNGK